MSENKGLVKCAIGLVLTILVIVGAMFGLNVDVEVTDSAENTLALGDDFIGPIQEEAEIDSEQEVADTSNEVVDENQSPADSTPTEDEQPVVDESDGAEVTQPTDETENVVTEGEN